MGRLDQEVINLKAKLQEAKKNVWSGVDLALSSLEDCSEEWEKRNQNEEMKEKKENENEKEKKKITTSSYYTSKQGVCIASQNTQMRYSIAGIATTDQRMH
ncbi:hypothetical protein LWI28_021981 [Acer negundo]|uniref:Uncharacterized protein n=1 Tax=Acer negundo TaxID=4023 RepID=A0AAD5NVT7_ACENE|nr:hypothetical protein LWI28_021981 [Acer negundo]